MRREWKWFRGSGMINNQHLINDGLKMKEPNRCMNNGQRTWTYNQGVILGGLVEMSAAEKKAGHSDGGALKIAKAIAETAMEQLKDPHGALGEPDGAHDGADVPQFKGILARNLMVLNRRVKLRGYTQFVMQNAALIWSKDRNEDDQLGFWWGGPFDKADAARQSAALDLLVAADALKAEGGQR